MSNVKVHEATCTCGRTVRFEPATRAEHVHDVMGDGGPGGMCCECSAPDHCCCECPAFTRPEPVDDEVGSITDIPWRF